MERTYLNIFSPKILSKISRNNFQSWAKSHPNFFKHFDLNFQINYLSSIEGFGALRVDFV
ncbi:hypothetical protein V6Z11_D05G315800 [Gossypium hirsutum]